MNFFAIVLWRGHSHASLSLRVVRSGEWMKREALFSGTSSVSSKSAVRLSFFSKCPLSYRTLYTVTYGRHN